MRTFFLGCLLALILASSAQAQLIAADRINEPQSLLPYCSWLPDPEGRLGIDDIASGSSQERFAPLAGGISLKGAGPVWIRLVIIKSATHGPLLPSAGDKTRLTVNLGELPPGRTTIYFPDAPGAENAPVTWHAEPVAAYEGIALPEPGLLATNAYIRMDEMPGLWFAPTVSAKDAKRPDLLPPELLLPGLLIAAAIVCLLRALAERASWAFWSSLFLLAAVGQAVLPLPSPGRSLDFTDLPALLAPGMGLMLLPHIGRCLFRTDKSGHFQDVLLYLCSLMGLCLALAPLVPGFGWITRLFPLTPLLFAPLLPLGLGALAARRPGSLAYTGATLMPFLGACAALYALKGPGIHPLAVPLMAQGGLWGMVVGGFGLALARIPKPAPEERDPAEDAGLMLAASAVEEARAEAEDKGVDLEKTPAFARRSQYDELPPLPVAPVDGEEQQAPALDMDITAIRPPEEEPAPEDTGPDTQSEAPEPETRDAGEDQAPPGEPDVAAPEIWLDENAPEEAEPPASPPEAEQAEVIAEDATLEPTRQEEPAQESPVQEDFPPEEAPAVTETIPAPQEPPRPAPASPVLPDFAGTSDSLLQEERSRVISLVEEDFSAYPLTLMEELREEPSRYISLTPDGGFLFNLHALVREVHDIVAPFAKTRGLIFSWYIAPSLPVLLEGDAPRLRGALSLLLQNAVLASRHGAVQLAVRRQPDAESPGDLLFTISDNGSAHRSDAGFFHAWELAARTGGTFNVEYSPSTGTRISFSVRFGLPSEDAAKAHLAQYPLPTEPLPDSDAQEDEQSSALAAPHEAEEPVPVLHAIKAKGREPVQIIEPTPAEAAWMATVSPSPAFADLSADSGADRHATPDMDRPAWEAAPAILPVAEEPSTGTISPAGLESASEAPSPPVISLSFEEESPSPPGEPAGSEESSPVQLIFPEEAALPAPAEEPAREPTRELAEEPHAEPEQQCIVAAEMTTSKRRLLAHYLQDLPRELCNAATHAQALELLRTRPVSLFIFDGDMPEPDIAATIAAIRKEEKAAGRPATPILVLTSHEGQSVRLLEAGATHALVKPFPQEALLDIAAQAVPALAPFVPAAPPSTDTASAPPESAPKGESPAKPEIVTDLPTASPPEIVVEEGDATVEAAPEPAARADEPGPSASSDMPKDVPAKPEIVTGLAAAPPPEIVLEEPAAAMEAVPLDHFFAGMSAAFEPAGDSPSSPAHAGPPVLEMPRPQEPPAPPVLEVEDAERDHPHKRSLGKPRAVHLQSLKPTLASPRETGAPASAPEIEPAALAPQEPAGSAEHAIQEQAPDTGTVTIRKAKRPLSAPVVVSVQSSVEPAPAAEPAPVAKTAPVTATEPEIVTATPLPEVLFPGASTPRAAAPIIMGLSTEDVTPAEPATEPASPPEPDSGPPPEAQEAAPGDQTPEEPPAASPESAPGGKGSLLDFVLAPEETATRPPDPEPASELAPEPAPDAAEKAEDTSSSDEPAPTPDQAKAPAPAMQGGAGQLYPLPGIEGEALDASMLPLAPGLVYALNDTLTDTLAARERGSTVLAQEASSRLAAKAEHFGLFKLGKIARCVERAAEADDMEAVTTLLEDLDPITRRYIDAVQQCFQSFLDSDR